jgi:late competence protein required for DNA uptake (superfamily II DNA/RNA helicase)
MIVEQITKYCKRCNIKFKFGDMDKSLQGQMARKYCDNCIVLQQVDYIAKSYRSKHSYNEIISGKT